MKIYEWMEACGEYVVIGDVERKEIWLASDWLADARARLEKLERHLQHWDANPYPGFRQNMIQQLAGDLASLLESEACEVDGVLYQRSHGKPLKIVASIYSRRAP